MKSRFQFVKLLTALAVMCAFPVGAAAQALNSNQASVALNAVLGESITVSTGAVATVNFTLTSGAASNPGSVTIPVNTSWVLGTARTSLSIYAYFDTAAAALSNTAAPTIVIPSANVEGSVNAGALTAFTANTAFGVGHGLLIGTVAITAANRTGSRADTLALNINLSALSIAAGTYTGTLRLQAQAP